MTSPSSGLPGNSVKFASVGSKDLYYWVGSDGTIPNAMLIYSYDGTANGALQISTGG